MTKADVLSIAHMKTIRIFAVTFALLTLLAVMPMQTRAAGLTETQISALLSLLQSFGAEQSVVANTETALRGGASPATESGIEVALVDTSVEKGSQQNTGTFTMSFDVTAVDDDIYLDRSVTRVPPKEGISAGDGFSWIVMPDSTTDAVSATAVVVTKETESGDSRGAFKVSEGETRRFTMVVTLEAAHAGTIALGLASINWTTDSSDTTPDNQYTAGLGSFQTSFLSFDSSSVQNIKVTAPNGGEQWEIGSLNTITWAPYSYNPDVNPSKDVDAYLMYPEGGVAGKIMDTGKASLHTYFNINDYNTWPKPDVYQVRVVNRVTGASDVSDKYFTLLPRAVDLKVNGSDGPITIASNQKITVSWAGTGVKYCALYNVQNSIGGTAGNIANLPSSGTLSLYFTPARGASVNVWISCERPDGATRGDAVPVNNTSPQPASLQITSPNGGEQIPIGQQYKITWRQAGLSNVSIALYSSDQWKEWIVKDLSLGKDALGVYSYIWTPSPTDTNRNTFKIYITGQKADGSGYVDDKSDAPFSFVTGSPQNASLSASPTSGTAPLALRFSTSINTCDTSRYSIDYGDGTTKALDSLVPIGRSTTNCYFVPTSWPYSYAKAGTYYARLMGGTCNDATYEKSHSDSSSVCYSPSVKIVVDSNSKPACTMSASPSKINPGQTSTVTWTSSNAATAQLSPEWGGEPLNHARVTIVLSKTTTYTGTFTSSSGQVVTCSATVTVAPPVSAAYTLSGYVWSDTDGNGTYSTNEQKLSGRQVELAIPDGATIKTMATDTSGNYAFSGLSAGSYRVRHEVPAGYSRTTDDSLVISITANATLNFGIKQGAVSSATSDARVLDLAGAVVALANSITEAVFVRPFSMVVNGLASVILAISPQSSSANVSAAVSAAAGTGLTEEQVSAVSSLLASFNTDEKMVAQIRLMLKSGGAVKQENKKEGERKMATTTKSGEVRPPLARICPEIAQMLKRGHSGEEVKRLQEFLAQDKDIYPNGEVTGYFGAMTEVALQKWQAKMGVVASGDANTTGFGALGPKTRELIKMKCGEMLPPPKPGMGSSTQNSSGKQGKQPGGVMCAADAKMCPDGRYVGRSGPNCEFKCASASSTQQ
ncbi:peptidoglycan-binding protein [Acetobacteraceae bacterium]|nr:peptidoglycan-binding protein [Candidatus Parcubacteria bacterium]